MKVCVLGVGSFVAGCSYWSHYKGYLKNPSATASTITPDGWFKTGDIATSDAEGFLTIIDRRKELIKYKVGAFPHPASKASRFEYRSRVVFADGPVQYGAVPPAELEALLLQHPDVADAAVVGIYSKQEVTELPRYAEYPLHIFHSPETRSDIWVHRAYIVPTRPIAPHENAKFALQVQAWIAGRVAAHKKLRGGVITVGRIPKR
ncbi:hypothetical protein J3R82DRAFT_1482 [Butyriboletus roseoflavus]|nr:hypothetical protein J3R82DRAFT_1482 [Butyriboletus roseoflavus]